MSVNRGVLLGVLSYLLWGLSPIYWRIEGDVPLVDVILWRAAGAASLLLGWQIVRGSLGKLRELVAKPRDLLRYVVTTTLLASNWIAFIWVVTTDRVLEASLGYFINPLMSVVLGVIVLGERLRFVPLVTVVIAAVGVLVLAVDIGSVPWTALHLAASFALYGLFRKTSPAGSMDGLTIEMLILFPFVVSWLIVRAVTGDGVFGLSDTGLNVWLLGTGAMTIAPLLLFSASARRIELWIVGMLQFLAPTIQFLLGVFLWNEPWRGGQALGFILIWLALVVFVANIGVDIRRARRLVNPAR